MKRKKLLTFGFVSLFCLALVSAIIVPYLGNKVEMNVEVESPMKYLINGAEEPINFNVHGGESVEFTVQAIHLANVDTWVEAENILSNEDGLTCADIDMATVHAVSTEGWETTLVLGELGFECVVLDENNLRFLYGETVDLYGVGREDTMDVTVTFVPNALGTYKFTATPLYPTA